MEKFKSVCNKLNISENITNEWKSKIESQYLKENRYYHNIAMLNKKVELIEDQIKNESLRQSLIFASIFQYYHFDAKRDRRDENCDEFRLFVEETGIKEVRKLIFSIILF